MKVQLSSALLLCFCVQLSICGYYSGPSVNYLPSNNHDGYYQHQQYKPKYPEHVPVITEHGVPEETPEVQHAKAQHLAALAKASALDAQSGGYEKSQPIHYHAASIQHAVAPIQHQSISYPTTKWSNSLPQDTAEVAATKAAHLLALQKAQSLELSQYGQIDNGEYHGEQFYENKVASNNYHHGHYRRRRSIFSHHVAQHVPVITKDGVPQETPEVQAAKAQHLLAHAQAQHNDWTGTDYNNYNDNNGYGSHGYGASSSLNSYGHGAKASSVHYTIQHDQTYNKYHGPEHYPVIGKDGVPIDTPEVQLARAQHLHALTEAKSNPWAYQQQYASGYSGHNDYNYGHGSVNIINGVPEETPEVQLAKAQHFAAIAKEQAKHSQWANNYHY